MSWSTEKDIRLFVLMHDGADPIEFQSCYESSSPSPPPDLRQFTLMWSPWPWRSGGISRGAGTGSRAPVREVAKA